MFLCVLYPVNVIKTLEILIDVSVFFYSINIAYDIYIPLIAYDYAIMISIILYKIIYLLITEIPKLW